MKNLILFIIIIISSTAYSQTKQLKLASDIWPPFTNVENKKSFATDLVVEALSRNNIETKIEIEDFNDVLAGIHSGNYDGSAALWISVEREKEYLYSKPYLVNQLILVGPKESDVSAESFQALVGKRIGVVKNYAYGLNQETTDNIDFISGQSDQQNLERLLSGQIDYMLVDALLMQYLLKYQVNDVTAYLETGKKTLQIKTLHFALRKDVSNAEEIISGFNTTIDSMIADGSYNRILELNWIQADLDGDGTMELISDGNMAGKEPPENVYGLDGQSFSDQSTNAANRYYIGGKTYYSWDNIPQEYKNEIVMGSQTVEGMGIKLDFK